MRSIFLLFGIMISKFGSAIQMVAMPLYILGITKSTSDMGNIYGVGLFFGLVASLFSGIIADSYNRKKILVYCDLISGILLFATVYLLKGDVRDLKLIYIVQITLSVITFIFGTALSSIIPEIFERSEIGKINSYKSILSNSAYIIGPLIGSYIFFNYGIKYILVLNGASFLISAIVEISLKYQQEIKREISKITILEDYATIFKIIKNSREIILIFIVVLLINLVVTPIFPIVVPSLIMNNLELKDIYGALNTLLTVGIIISSYVTGKIIGKYNVVTLMLGGLSIITFSFVFLLLPLSKVFLILFSFTFGLSMSLINIPIDTYFQENIPSENIGKFFAVLDFSAQLFAPLSMFLMGYLLEAFSVRSIMTFWTIFFIIVLMLIYKKYLRRING